MNLGEAWKQTWSDQTYKLQNKWSSPVLWRAEDDLVRGRNCLYDKTEQALLE